MHILTLPILTDNYCYLLIEAGQAVVIDPGEAAPVLAAVAKAGVKLQAALLTHRHQDHTGGCTELRAQTQCKIIGPAECEACALDQRVGEGDRYLLGGVPVGVLAIPGHTLGHVAYYCEAEPAVWTGDTLFAGGCGRVLEGTAKQMWHSLCRLRALPEATHVHCGHDYTLDNLEFGASILPNDVHIALRCTAIRTLAAADQPTGTSTVAIERTTNIFLQADTAAVRQALKLSTLDPVVAFAELRHRKDQW